MPAREAAACGERKIVGRGKALKTAVAENRKEQAEKNGKDSSMLGNSGAFLDADPPEH